MSYGLKALKVRWTDTVRWPVSETRFRVNDKGNSDTGGRMSFAAEKIVKVENRLDINVIDEPGTWEDLTSLVTSSVTSNSIDQVPITFTTATKEAMSNRDFLRKIERLHHGYPPGD